MSTRDYDKVDVSQALQKRLPADLQIALCVPA